MLNPENPDPDQKYPNLFGYEKFLEKTLPLRISQLSYGSSFPKVERDNINTPP